MAQSQEYLFGGDKHWAASSFTASDDRVRGGSSLSHLSILQPANHALFHGSLDTSTLGGAGFASQRTTAEAYPAKGCPLAVPRADAWDLEDYGGLEVAVVRARSDAKRYVLTIKDEVPERRPDGRDESGITWEWEFVVEGQSETEGDADGVERLAVEWSAFKPTYRGKDVDRGEVKPLNLGNVKRVGIMMRSFFGEQEGEFALCLASIAVVKM